MNQKESCFLPVVFSAALVLLIVPVIVSAERHNSPGTVYSLNNASESDGSEVPVYKNLNFNSSTAEIEVFNPGDDPDDPEAAYLKFAPSKRFRGLRHLSYHVEDIAPNRVVNGIELDEPEPSHRSRNARAYVRLISRR